MAGSTENIDKLKHPELAWLGMAIDLLSHCDEAIFGYGWEKSHGCVVEATTCKEYGIPQIRICRKGLKERREELPKEQRKRLEEYDKKFKLTLVDVDVLQKEIHEKHLKAIEVGKAKLHEEKKE